MIHANENSIPIIKDGSFERQKLSQGIKQLLSSYTKGINKQLGRTGSLFQQKTKAKLTDKNAQTDFHYIHQNPLRAGLISKMEDWPYRSFSDYILQREGICNKELAIKLLDFKHFKAL